MPKLTKKEKKLTFSMSFYKKQFQYVSLPYSLKRSQSYQNYYIKHILNTEKHGPYSRPDVHHLENDIDKPVEIHHQNI